MIIYFRQLVTYAQVKVSHVLVSIIQYVAKHFVTVNMAILRKRANVRRNLEKLHVTQVTALLKDVSKIIVVFVRITCSMVLTCASVLNVSDFSG